MPAITTNTGTRTTTIVWTTADIALLQWAINRGYLGASVATTVVQAAEFILSQGWLQLTAYYKTTVASRRQLAFDAAAPAAQASADSAIAFDPASV
jgi:hypothetical protein